MTKITGPVAVPSYSFEFGVDGHVQVNGDCVGYSSGQFIINDRVISDTFESLLPSHLTDLVDVALATYIADRAARRTPPGVDKARYGWARKLRLRIPVADPARWAGPLYTPLIEALTYFTEDVWEFDFYDKGSRIGRGSAQGSLFPVAIEEPVRTALFSGGLDSLAGLCREIVECPFGTIVLFAGRTNSRIGWTQGRLIEMLNTRLGGSGPKIIPCVVPFGFKNRQARAGDKDESTQRTRGFIYAAFGAVAAVMAGANRLSFYENGVGCINLPYTRAQFGTHLTRATHPLGMSRMSVLVSMVLESPFEFDLPNIFVTKGELCRSIAELGASDLVQRTISCDGVARISTKPQCGLCTSCLLRRQSLHAAGLETADDGNGYILDIFGSLKEVDENKLYPFRAMLHQVERLRAALGSSASFEGLTAAFPELLELALTQNEWARSTGAVGQQLARLYSTYCAEWDAFPARPPAPRPRGGIAHA